MTRRRQQHAISVFRHQQFKQNRNESRTEMKVEVTHNDAYSDIEEETYIEEVPDDASLQRIWDIVANGGENTDEITEENRLFEQAKEGLIIFDDNNESYADHRIEISWEARSPEHTTSTFRQSRDVEV